MQTAIQIPLTAALTSGRVGVTDLTAARWHERMCKIYGSERKAERTVLGRVRYGRWARSPGGSVFQIVLGVQ
jgi:hypothetical protein